MKVDLIYLSPHPHNCLADSNQCVVSKGSGGAGSDMKILSQKKNQRTEQISRIRNQLIQELQDTKFYFQLVRKKTHLIQELQDTKFYF